MELKLPAPCIVVLIGPSSSGKTTWAREHFEGNEVVSSDSLRSMVGVDEDDQRASKPAFEILEKVVDERMDRRLTTVIDTTGLNEKNRKSWISRAHDADLPIYAAVMETPPDECERRNAERSRPLPKATRGSRSRNSTMWSRDSKRRVSTASSVSNPLRRYLPSW